MSEFTAAEVREIVRYARKGRSGHIPGRAAEDAAAMLDAFATRLEADESLTTRFDAMKPVVFTPSLLRRMAARQADSVDGLSIISEALETFARRLEQDAQAANEAGVVYVKPEFAGRLNSETGFTPVNKMLEQAREEGRREILAEIAAIDPWAYAPGPDECHFCKLRKGGTPEHAPDCLWHRAFVSFFALIKS